MGKRVCPWWLGYFLASPLRRLFSDDPHRLLAPYIRPGMTVLEPGPGMGYFTLELARLVEASGRVVTVEIQPKMLRRLMRRAERAGLAGRIQGRLGTPVLMGLCDVAGKIDFTLAFAVVHEMPDPSAFFTEVAAASKPQAQVLFAEPSGHVKPTEFEAELAAAWRAGFVLLQRPAVRGCHAALLRKAA